MARLNGVHRPLPGVVRPPSNYLHNEDLIREIRASQRIGRVTPKLGEMLLFFVNKRSEHPWFSRYSYRDDLVSEAVITVCAAALKFDVTRKNPFAYLQTTIHRALGRALKKEYRHWRLRDQVDVDDIPLLRVSETCSVSAAV